VIVILPPPIPLRPPLLMSAWLLSLSLCFRCSGWLGRGPCVSWTHPLWPQPWCSPGEMGDSSLRHTVRYGYAFLSAHVSNPFIFEYLYMIYFRAAVWQSAAAALRLHGLLPAAAGRGAGGGLPAGAAGAAGTAAPRPRRRLH
jgi:hypothetical protein